MAWMRMPGGGFLPGVNWAAVFAFFAIAAAYLLAPAVGHRLDPRGAIPASLYCLIGYTGVSLLQLVTQYFLLLDRSNQRGPGNNQAFLHSLFAFVKMILFLAAMLLFVTGLQSPYKRRRGEEVTGNDPAESTRIKHQPGFRI